MAQGRSRTLSNKPSERRVVFEEAAGIPSLSSRKDTLRKLDYTEQNLSG